jgi:hypothetical protein
MALCIFCEWSVLAWMLRVLAYGFILSIHYNGERKGRYIPYTVSTFTKFLLEWKLTHR